MYWERRQKILHKNDLLTPFFTRNNRDYAKGSNKYKHRKKKKKKEKKEAEKWKRTRTKNI